MCEVLASIQEYVSRAFLKPFWSNFRLQLIKLVRQHNLDAIQCELLFPHFLHHHLKQSHKREFATQKKGVEGSATIRKAA